MPRKSNAPVEPASRPAAPLADLARHSSAVFTADHTYFADAEPHIAGLWTDLILPFISPLENLDTVLDLACGHGRNSAILHRGARKMVLVDMQPGNIEVCKNRFKQFNNVSYIVNNGYDLQDVPSDSISLLYCFDAMVHFDSDVVRAYLTATARVLKSDGRAFLHHSNYTGGEDWTVAPSNRNFMSKDLMAHYARKEGLTVLKQQLLGWGGTADHDCFTLLGRPR